MSRARELHAAYKQFEAGDITGSAHAFQALLALDSTLVEAHYGLACARIVQSKWTTADESVAVLLERIVRSDALVYPNVLIYAAREYSKGRRFDLAALAMHSAVRQMGRQAPLLLLLARCELALGNDTAAEALAREVGGASGGIDATFILGHALDRQGRFAEACACYRAVMQERPTYPRIASLLASALYAHGETEEALALAAATAMVEPGNAIAHFALARCHVRRNDHDAAEKALLALPRSHDFVTCEMEVLAGRPYWSEEAPEQLQILRAFWPLLGEVIARQGWMERALAESQARDDLALETIFPEIRTGLSRSSGDARITLVTCGDAKFRYQQERLTESALVVGECDEALLWTRADIEGTQFFRNHPTLLSRPRGAGYWAWKPYVILRALTERPDGAYVVYHDCGRGEGYRFTGSVRSLVAWCARERSGILPGVQRHAHGPNLHWTKRDCFHFMGCDTPVYWNRPQLSASPSVWRNTPEARAFVRAWLEYCLDPRIVSDHANVSGLPNHEAFFDHRHDQSVLTNLVERHGLYAPQVASFDINEMTAALRPPVSG